MKQQNECTCEGLSICGPCVHEIMMYANARKQAGLPIYDEQGCFIEKVSE